ncbi:MAG: calcium/sodium antiporter [Pseudomonadota bacterium]
MLSYLLLPVGFAFLIKGADLLVDGASSIAKRFKVSDLVIGLTVVAFGTSSPELFVNIVASHRGNTDIAIGNILGSNISNFFLILGISSMIYPLTVTKGTVWREIPSSLLAAILLGILVNERLIDGTKLNALTRTDGLVFISFFIIFIYYTLGIAKKVEGLEDHVPQRAHGFGRSLALVIVGLIGLIVGAQWIVNGAVHIALSLGMSESLVGLTIVAIGTSLPELATSTVAAYKRNVEIAVGNVVGSNIFNIFFVLGISSIIKPLPFHAGYNVDIGVVIFSSLLLFLSMFTGKKRSIDRWEGLVFVAFYTGYMIFVIIRG